MDMVMHFVRGFHYLINIKEGRRTVFFCCPGIGDTFYNLIFLDEYIKKRKIRNAVLYCPESYMSILDYFKPNLVTIRKYENSRALDYYYTLSLIDRFYPDCRFKLMQPFAMRVDYAKSAQFENIEEIYYHKVFGLEGEVTNYCLIEETSERKNGILILPDSNSVEAFSTEFWGKVIKFVLTNSREKVYLNFTNMKSLYEFKGIEKYNKSIGDLFTEAKDFKFVISARNGMCDLLIKQSCVLIVLYPAFSEADWFKQYSMKGIYKNAELKEILVNDEKDITHIKEELNSIIADC